MRIFYTGSDIEDLAARGVRQLEIGPGVALTDAARERAEELGILLLTPQAVSAGSTLPPAAAVPFTAASTGKTAAFSQQASTPQGTMPATTPGGSEVPFRSLPGKPRGCQHAPFGSTLPPRTNSGGGAVVDQLVQAVSALKKGRQDGQGG